MDKFLLKSATPTSTPTSASVSTPTSKPSVNSDPINPSPDSENPVIDLEEDETKSKKKPRRISKVWDHFRLKPGCDPEDPRGECIYCGKDYACSTKKCGTSSMLVHLNKQCKKSPFRVEDTKQKLLSFPASTETGSGGGGLLVIGFNKEACRNALAKMVISDEMPFRTVEGEGFRHFCQVMQPKFTPPSRVTVARDILQLFTDEKAKLKATLRTNCRRMCFTTDAWTSMQNLHYLCLTGHYIDCDWKLQKRILNFCTMPNGKGETIGKLIEYCMHGWGIEKVLTVSMDNATANDVAINVLKRRVNGWNGAVLDGEFIHQRCVAHIVNMIVSEGLEEINGSVAAIRNAVKYVKLSGARLQKFEACVEREKIDYKGLLVLDMPTRWNSTYMMLDVAVKFQKAFDRYEEEDDKYLGYFLEEEGGKRKVLGPPMMEDWDNAKVFVQFLRTFYEVTLKFSASQHVTSNTFFHEICNIHMQLKELCEKEDSLLSAMAMGMRRKFEKYWGNGDNVNCLLFVAVVLDPRYKLDYLKYCFGMIYDAVMASKLCKKVDQTLERLLNFYGGSSSNAKDEEGSEKMPSKEAVEQGQVNNLLTQFLKQKGNTAEKNDLERYLADENVNPLIPYFDILGWWKDNSRKFKVLSQIARDVLAIQVSTVASESAFSTGGRILDPFRSSLSPKMVEALVCTQNWLRSSHEGIQIRDYLDESQVYEQIIPEVPPSNKSTIAEEPMNVD